MMGWESTTLGHLPELTQLLAPGVAGYTVEHEGALYVPLLIALQPGNGDVGRYLDSLPKDRCVKVPNVISQRLIGMLERRGFTLEHEWCAEVAEPVEVWTRPPVDNAHG